jgi:hypothetical protein
MHHAPSGYIQMVSGEDVSRLDINDHGSAATACHRASNRRLQRRYARLSRYGVRRHDAHKDRGATAVVQAGHASIVTARRKRGGYETDATFSRASEKTQLSSCKLDLKAYN